jgi:hypothetical protein
MTSVKIGKERREPDACGNREERGPIRRGGK